MARLKKNSKGYIMKTFMYAGKRYYVYGKDQKELLEKTAQKMKELEEGKEKQVNPSLNAYYEYFTELRRKEQREATIRAQKYQYKNIAETITESGKKFGELKIKDITRRDIETARQTLLESGKTPENLNICFKHLNHVFECAVTDDTIQKNPCKALKMLKRESESIGQNRHRALTESDSVSFLNASKDRNSFYHNAFKLMLLTGMRIGEVGALCLTDIDNDFIHVRRTVTRDEVGVYQIGEGTKTYSGKRDIPVTPEIKKLLRDQRELNNMFFGFQWSGTLFKSSDGQILREYTINREIARICKDVQIEKFTCHGFRVTFATRFIEQRPQDFKILSEILGHKDISITLNLYTKVMKESKITAMNDLKIKTS
ncbi:Site-specific recombinase XerD [Eubacterium ruminantium]|uniref:Site-specific recombinase XerD n=1 Tax=Eubacterium ruminantium TaxID=42322 RepID=A0A1T4QVG9_9FIRM|nr:site-specific integrase [Eubacterium ruminantium]SCW28294.1 Site-specific recombinase XerD [Eubacterium ruminantium]SDM12063.1 Site-specific recombinase XerD [Eubacterium ruminantium]SKA07684.1 Site-specific recombinase XerD [Eubacterium ruminantium]